MHRCDTSSAGRACLQKGNMADNPCCQLTLFKLIQRQLMNLTDTTHRLLCFKGTCRKRSHASRWTAQKSWYACADKQLSNPLLNPRQQLPPPGELIGTLKQVYWRLCKRNRDFSYTFEQRAQENVLTSHQPSNLSEAR